MNDTRRDFLKLCGLAGLGFACPGGLTSIMRAATKEAAPYEDRSTSYLTLPVAGTRPI